MSGFRVNKKGNLKSASSSKTTVNLDDGDDEGLALLIPDIQETFLLVQSATCSEAHSGRDDEDSVPIDRPIMHSIEEKYKELMTRLQFGKFWEPFWPPSWI